MLPLMAVPVLGLSGTAQAAATVPSAPTAVSVVVNDNASATLTWTVGADGGDPITYFVVTPYINGVAQTSIVQQTGSAGDQLDPTPGAIDSDPIADDPGPGYTFTVASENAIGIGPSSIPTNEVTLIGYPATPTNVSAVASATQITLHWTVGANNGFPITGFVIIYEAISSGSATGEPAFTLAAGAPGSHLDPTPGAQDSAVMPDTTADGQYAYEIQATNSEGNSDPSSDTQGWVYSQLLNPNLPSAPTDVSAVEGENATATLTWTVGAEGSSPITQFLITPYIGTTAQPASSVIAGAVGSALDPTPGATDTFAVTEYQTDETFTVDAENALGYGPASSPSNEVALLGGPATPTDVSAVASATQITLHWTVGADNGYPITGFVITYEWIPAGSPITEPAFTLAAGAPGSNLDPTPGAQDSAVMPDTAADSQYAYEIQATNAEGISSSSSSTQGWVYSQLLNPTLPGAPTDVSAVDNDNATATVTWTVGTEGSSPTTYFLITPYIGTTAQENTTVVAGPVGSDRDPTPGAIDSAEVIENQSDETFTVESENALGIGPASLPSNEVSTTSAPSPPINVSANASATQIKVSWSVGADNGLSITAFSITTTDLTTDATTTTTIAVGAVGSPLDPTPGAQDSAVVPANDGQQYRYQVAAANADGTGGESPYSGTYELQVPFLQTLDGVSVFSFQNTLVGDVSADLPINVANTGGGAAQVTGYVIGGADPDDFFVDTSNCQSIAAGDDCSLNVGFLPGAVGLRTASLTVNDGAFGPLTVSLSGTGTEGYYVATSTGGIFGYGDAPSYGDPSNTHLTKPIVAIQATGDDGGYWLAASDGGVFAYGDAQFYGSTGAIHLNKPIVGMAATPDGGGYWLVASDGGIFSFGDARFYGSTGAIHLNKPIVGMAVTPDGGGYWLVASDGGIFSFGDARFYGSTGAIHLNKPIVGMAPTPDGDGYWLVASDGGIFSFGDAQFYGSTGAIHLNEPIIGMAATPDGGGYWLTASDGGVFNFGDAPFDGSTGGLGITNAIGVAGSAPPTLQAFLNVPALKIAK